MTKTETKPPSFELDDIIAKAARKPDPVAKPELWLLYSQAGSGKTHTASGAVDISDDTKVLYIDVEGSTPGVVTNHKNWRNIDIVPVYEMTASDEERAQGITNEIKRFKYLRTLLSEKYLFSGKETKYDYVVIDTFDVAQDYAIDFFEREAQIAADNLGGEVNGFSVWADVKKWTLSVAKNMKSMKPVGILVQHDREEKAKSGAIVKKLALSGSAKDILPGIPDVVLYLERRLVKEPTKDDPNNTVEVTVGYFASEDGKVTKNRFGFPAKVKNPTIPKLLELIEKKAGK